MRSLLCGLVAASGHNGVNAECESVGIESSLGMEILLNFAWALMAIACLGLWFRFGRHTGVDRCASFVALVMLLVILFPVISVSDDLWSAQNPSETDTCQRRAHRDCCSHTSLQAVASLPLPVFAELSFGIQRFSVSLPPRSVRPGQSCPRSNPEPAPAHRLIVKASFSSEHCFLLVVAAQKVAKGWV